MESRLLQFLADPNDGGALQLHSFEGDERSVRDGALLNPQTGRWFPVRDGIPTLFADALRVGGMKDEDAAFARKYQSDLRAAGADLDAAFRGVTEGDFARIESERRARDEQAEDYDKMLSLKIYERIETPTYRAALGEYSHLGQFPLLEAGCGTGRFTGLFSEIGTEVLAIDMSRDSILRNRVRHAGRTFSPVHYVHADLTHLPVASEKFGSVAHCGVYEHIPSREMRQQFLEHAQRVLLSDGVLLLSAYRYGGLTKLFEKEGEHAGGIPFTRFTEDELRGEIEPYFEIKKFRPNLGIYMSMVVAQPKAHVASTQMEVVEAGA
jgi:ubiquinone/menaquinone biosynthesis C-methylase UbiE/uncharacterized protein YbaR (Trm112 family)